MLKLAQETKHKKYYKRISQKDRKFTSKLNVNGITVSNLKNTNFPAKVMPNNQAIEQAEAELDYGYSYKKDK